MRQAFFFFGFLLPLMLGAQSKLYWQNVDSAFAPLPSSVHIYFTQQKIDTAPFRAFYLTAQLKDAELDFTTDTTDGRRITPSQFFEKNDRPLVVVNGTFFSFETNKNLNLVVRKGKLLAYNVHSVPGRKNDTLTYRHPFASAIGIDKNRQANIEWVLADSGMKETYASSWYLPALKDSAPQHNLSHYLSATSVVNHGGGTPSFRKWKIQTAIGGGPVLVQNGQIKITNNEELKFAGKAINDKHPRTAMGYTKDNQLIILVVEGRNPDAGGASLVQLATIMKDLGCVEALNLDGGGSSCMLVNGKETIKPSDKAGQRSVPAVFLIQAK